MIRALYSSASGLQAQQNNLDVIANNLVVLLRLEA